MNNKQKTFHKPANVFVKPEMVLLQHSYAFSFNPIGQPKIGKLLSVKDWFESNTNLFKNVIKYAKVELYTEISSLGRFHFHGTIEITDIAGFYTKDIAELMIQGTSNMKEIEQLTVWLDYVVKQQTFMQAYLNDEIYGPLVIHQGVININTYPQHQNEF